MVFIPLVILALILLICVIKFNANLKLAGIVLLGGLLITLAIVAIDQAAQTTDTEVWSGSVVDLTHKEEWDEWHPPRTETYTTTSNGKTETHTRVIPGYWEHHYATNDIRTSDDGWMSVDTLPDGRKMDDKYPNSTEELKQYWPLGTPSASTHTYENKVQASYSIYRHKDIDLKQYKDLPQYPKDVHNYINVDRILGDFPNKDAALKVLATKNTELNKFIPDPDKPGKTKSWKQVNIIFVNVGADKPIEYGYALQDYWEGGNKNDFVVTMSMSPDGKVNWVYPFSWSEVEILKIDIRDYLMDMGTVTDLVPVVNKVSDLVAEKFVRKQFADFSYLNIETSTPALVIIWVIMILGAGFFMKYTIDENTQYRRRQNYY